MAMKRYLTKSRFVLATECPTKLFYTGKAEYASQSVDDSFLVALAEGGFQVGELAKLYFPGGHNVAQIDHDEALAKTAKLLSQEEVIIYEAAIAIENLFVRVDILVKNGTQIDLYEVKSKSHDPTEDTPFTTNKGAIKADWKPYLYDVAFQKYVVTQAFPQHTVRAFLMMADKSATCPTDGLNQKFRLTKDENGRKRVSVSSSLNDDDLTPPILTEVNVDHECELIYAATYEIGDQALSFAESVELLSRSYRSNVKIHSPISTACAACEFHTTDVEEKAGLRSGKKECWKERLGWNDADFNTPTVLDTWNFRKKDLIIASNRIKMSDVVENDILPKSDGKPGLSPSERQWLQVAKHQTRDISAWIDRDNLRKEFDAWSFPLHFIDFETTMVAIPFNKGRHPYEGIAFQFSHHVVGEDGTVEHRGEYLNTVQGAFPNYDFIRCLKGELVADNGSIFRYSNHENSFLNTILQQLKSDPADISDRDELCDFIRSITHSVSSSSDVWTGDRDMIDLWELVKRYYYDPATNGSNSLKHVLPAILNSSDYLKAKYSKPIYGAEGGIVSRNFVDWQWVRFETNRKVIDPYKLLPRMFQDVPEKDMLILSEQDELNEGGAAMTAYARMQFEEMSEYERDEIRKALLKYCELDTLAMVMLYEGWRELVRS